MNATQLHGEIETPRPLRASGGKISLTGWCLAESVTVAPPVRLVTDAFTLPMSSRTDRSDVTRLLPAEPAAARCGFTLEGRLPAGVHLARFEAQVPGGAWQVFKQLTIVAESPPLTAVLDEPISEGTLRDRVKVGGWALDPAQPVSALRLRYGHREITCRLNQTRQDVAGAFPAVSHAGRSGFTSEDFLVAGHGPVRVRAQLADGRTVIAATKVTFSVATDENHEPELDLTAARIGLESDRESRPAGPVAPTERPLNILFILPGSFASNNALHVAALANELAAAGHACAVAVAHDRETLRHLDRPAFRGLTHAEAKNDPDFANLRGPDVIHAWTTRENVRLLAEQLRSRHGSRVIVHLEDNEQQILALSLGRSLADLAQLPDAELDRLVPADLSHPRLSRGFLARCDGVTVIMDRLREFVPNGKPCTTLMPAADARHYYLRPVPAAFRRALQLSPDTTVLFYHGNVHASNAAEVRELYAAVLELNRSGTPVTLLRTGLDRVDFLGELAGDIAPFVLALGQILHHRHLPPLMALADIFVQPGAPDAFNDYRFPSKLPEFFALGRPVVLPRTNLGAKLRHGVDAYVLDRADAAGIATAVRALRTDPALAERLSRGAAAYAAQHFSWRRSAEVLARFYHTLPGMPQAVPSPMRIAVTGGRGRLASLLAGHFGSSAHELSLFSRGGGNDFHDLTGLEAALPGHQALLHLAWSTLPATSEQGDITEWQTDLPALEKILQAIAALPGKQRPHFVFFSSGGAVYGNAPGRPSRETDKCQPIGSYGRAKRAAEELVERHAAQHGLACTILRISNPYGYPVPKSRVQGIIPHAMRCAVEGQPLTLWGDGHAQKDFLYYTDFLTAVEAVVARRLTGTFNLCAGESHTVREVIALVEKHTGKKIALSFQPAPAWDVEDSRLDNQRLAAAAGWRPQVSLDEGIRRSAAGYAKP
ncbi:MAG: NAD-dependent epimerase/dehydratase family protein [Lacunisphaera sp.]|nr:NAD-dependent epimerase/dehydratase family protein [Lacunisphaera sp.]